VSTREIIGSYGEIEHISPERTYWYSDKALVSDYDSEWIEERWVQVAESEATLVSSLCESGNHAPALDIDIPAELEQLSIPGYCMLTIDKPIKYAPYVELLGIMESIGLVPPGHARKLIAETPSARKDQFISRFIVGMEAFAELVPSSTPGHSHLYIDTEMPWKDYRWFLKSLARAGIIEEGFYRASVEREQTMLRKPGIYK